MAAPRRTYIVSVYRDDPAIVVESVQREERERLTSLDELPGVIRRWEADEQGHDLELEEVPGP
jgi:hypothetical protein